MTYRKIEAVRAAWGFALLLAPRWVLQNIHHAEVDTRSLVVARVLGARQLGQAALSGINPSLEVLAMGVWVDTVHSTSMIALAALDRPRTRAALTDATVAATWAALGYHDLLTTHGTTSAHDRTRDTMTDWMLSRLPGGPRLAARIRKARP